MDSTPAAPSAPQPSSPGAGNLRAEIHETHTGLVVLVGERAYKAKKPVVTDFLDFSTAARRESACRHELELNTRLAPDSYLGLAHFAEPGRFDGEPVIVMRRYPDDRRLAALVRQGAPVEPELQAVAGRLGRFHQEAGRGRHVDACGSVEAVTARWRENLTELHRYAPAVLADAQIDEVDRLATQFIAGRSVLFAQRIADRRVVDGHGDLIADDIFCMPEGPAILDCLEFDDTLRYVDTIDDAAFLVMDLEFLGRRDLGDHFLARYRASSDDDAPAALADFYVAYRAVVRAKVDCVRHAQGHPEAVADARAHLDIAAQHLRAATVRLVIVGGGPGTGKTTLARALAQRVGAQVISTDDVRKEMQRDGTICGDAGELNAGLYAPANVAAVYDEVLRRAYLMLCRGRSVILDGTWRSAAARQHAHAMADEAAAPVVELTCALSLEEAAARIEGRSETTSDATPQLAAALAHRPAAAGHPIDTSRPLTEALAEAEQICCLAI